MSANSLQCLYQVPKKSKTFVFCNPEAGLSQGRIEKWDTDEHRFAQIGSVKKDASRSKEKLRISLLAADSDAMRFYQE